MKALIATVLLLGSATAFESHIKMRAHRELIQNTFSKNFDLLLSRIEKEQEKDV